MLLGDADTDPDYPSLDRSENALLQGPHRFDPGKAFFIASREFAEASGWEFNWEMQFVPGVAHSNTLMAPAAGEVLFPADSHTILHKQQYQQPFPGLPRVLQCFL